jgi:hypothetical protein
MPIMRIAVLSCALYLGFVLLAEFAFFVVTLWKHGFGLLTSWFSWWGWIIWSCAVWILSTSLAYRLVWAGIRAELSHR